ncbi:MAG: hypothetical protein VR78_05280 [Hoeflea sp. BRH_c9]|nr:MAG: hypothetical protein VR78_05280 [Hoeflea sp. BRH_c9]
MIRPVSHYVDCKSVFIAPVCLTQTQIQARAANFPDPESAEVHSALHHHETLHPVAVVYRDWPQIKPWA